MRVPNVERKPLTLGLEDIPKEGIHTGIIVDASICKSSTGRNYGKYKFQLEDGHFVFYYAHPSISPLAQTLHLHFNLGNTEEEVKATIGRSFSVRIGYKQNLYAEKVDERWYPVVYLIEEVLDGGSNHPQGTN